MTDIVERLDKARLGMTLDIAGLLQEAKTEVERLLAAIQRIDGINDNPADYNPEINDVCNSILRPELADRDVQVRDNS